MTREEILEMKPGIELNMKVAEQVMGNTVVNDEILGYIERQISPKTETEEENSVCCSSCGGSTEDVPGWGPVERYSEELPIAMLVVNRMIAKGYNDATNWKNFNRSPRFRCGLCGCRRISLGTWRRARALQND